MMKQVVRVGEWLGFLYLGGSVLLVVWWLILFALGR